jgi:carbon-monoxide dehydrogenase large subunit
MDAKTDGRASSEPRVEDDVLVRGHGRYMADVPLPGQAYACFVRSPHAFARIAERGHASGGAKVPALSANSRLAMDTGDIGSISSHPPLAGRGGKALIMPYRPALAAERVTHIGEAVAMVVAESAAAAQDAAELIAIDYEPLTPVMDARAALAPGAPQVWPEAPGNLAIDWPGLAADPEANAREVDAIFAKAKFVARVALTNQRMAMASMEPRGATAQLRGRRRFVCFAGVLAGRPHHARQPCHDHENPAERGCKC